VGAHELVCLSGALLGSRADRLPATVRRLISLEGHASLEGQASFAALQANDAPAAIEEGTRR
jgi:hypothetical protein